MHESGHFGDITRTVVNFMMTSAKRYVARDAVGVVTQLKSVDFNKSVRVSAQRVWGRREPVDRDRDRVQSEYGEQACVGVVVCSGAGAAAGVAAGGDV